MNVAPHAPWACGTPRARVAVYFSLESARRSSTRRRRPFTRAFLCGPGPHAGCPLPARARARERRRVRSGAARAVARGFAKGHGPAGHRPALRVATCPGQDEGWSAESALRVEAVQCSRGECGRRPRSGSARVRRSAARRAPRWGTRPQLARGASGDGLIRALVHRWLICCARLIAAPVCRGESYSGHFLGYLNKEARENGGVVRAPVSSTSPARTGLVLAPGHACRSAEEACFIALSSSIIIACSGGWTGTVAPGSCKVACMRELA